MSVERFRRELSYDDWANREVLRHLQRESSPPARCVERLAHVLGTQSEWLARLQGKRSELAVWPRLTLDEIEEALRRLRSGWTQVLERLGPEDLEHTIAYTNSKGQPWTSRVGDVLAHVVLHGAYHRGQIASDLREAGLTPPCTDYIHATRTGLLEPLARTRR
jgi:uncharacterized damage-inducible protein DinB